MDNKLKNKTMKTITLILMLLFGVTAFAQETPTMSYKCYPVTTNGGYDGHIDLRFNNGLTRWIKVQK
jgi:hypothetical protein